MVLEADSTTPQQRTLDERMPRTHLARAAQIPQMYAFRKTANLLSSCSKLSSLQVPLLIWSGLRLKVATVEY